MENLDGLAKSLYSYTNFAWSAVEELASMNGKVERSLDKTKPDAENFGAACSGTARHINSVFLTAALAFNRGAQVAETVIESTNDDDNYDEKESEYKKMGGQINDLTDSAFAGAVSINKTRLAQFAQRKGARRETEKKEPLLGCQRCGGLREEECLEMIPDPNLECIGLGEKAMAENLRLWCTSYGEEKYGNLSETAAVLLRFGRLYLHKASCATTGMLQKISFIRCSVLLHAAKNRFEHLKEFREEIFDAFVAFFKSLLLAGTNGQAKEDILSNASLQIGTALENSRIAVEEDLEHFNRKQRQKEPFQDVSQMEKMQLGRIRGVKALNENMTQNYIALMQNIAEKCIQLLGKPPVKFAVAGLGSMARKEITLYSDFEHAILLEDGCHSDDVLEYFRWFTVLFQIIVIGIGETIVPTVCVKSINNLYSEKKGEDCWFYDIVTRCGIAFDGMAPHSCATPLGRQLFSNAEQSEDRAHPQELIKTASEMLAYLDPSDNFQSSGYNLKDLLSCTCLVFGDEEIYEMFRTECIQILKYESAHTVVQQHAERIIQNPNPQVRDGYFDHRGLGKLNAKAVYYRPFSVLIGSIGKIHKVEALGTFDVLEELRKKGAINSTLCHKLSYAFAVICEMRVRAYSQVQTQRCVFKLEDIHEMVGEEAEWAIKDMMQYLQDSIQRHEKAVEDGKMEALRMYNEQYVAHCPKNEVRNFYFCRQYEKAVEIAEAAERSNCDDGFQYWLFKSYYQAGRPEDKRAFWDGSERIYKRLTASKTLKEREKAECHCIMAEIFAGQKRFRDAYNTTKEWLQFYLNAGTKQNAYRHKLPAIYKTHIHAATKDMRPGDGDEHKFLLAICSQGNPECKSMFRFLRSMTSVASSKGFESCGSLRGLVEEITLMARDTAQPRLLLKVIWAFQVNNGQWTDAMRTADCLKEFPDITCTEEEHHVGGNREWLQLSGFCALGEFWQVLNDAVKNISAFCE